MKLRNIFKSRDKPRNSTPGQSFVFLYGGSTAGKNVSETSAMQMTAVYACVRILSEAVAGLPLQQGETVLELDRAQGWNGWLGLCDRITLMEKGKAAVRFRSGVEIEVEY